MNNEESKRAIIGERLKLARDLAGLSQGQVAKKLGLHRPSVSEMEAGRRKVSAEELSALSKMYGVTVAWLTGAEKEDKEDIDINRDRIELAARELAKLAPKDLDHVIQLLSALRTGKDNGQ